MLSCKNISEQASDYLEGPTTLGERLSFRFHLFICKNCRDYLSQLSLAMGTASRMPPPDEPTDAEIAAIVARLKDSP